MAAITGIDFGKQISKALGLEGKGVYDIQLNVPVDDAVTLTIKRYVQPEEAEVIMSVLEQYVLVEVR